MILITCYRIPASTLTGSATGTTHPQGNHTEIIYSVFVAGKPVLATTAAKDMELVTDEEVVHVLELPISTKAERKCLT